MSDDAQPNDPAPQPDMEIDDPPQPQIEIDDPPQPDMEIDDPPTPSDSCPDCDAGTDGDVARSDTSTNTAAAADRSACLPQGDIQQAQLAPGRQLTDTESTLLQATVYAMQASAILNPATAGVAVTFIAFRKWGNSQGCTVAIGLGGDAVGIGGASAGTGIYWDPNGQVGAYGSVALDAGFFAGLSAEAIITIIKGGADAFGGDSYALGGGGGEVISAGGFFLYDSGGKFYGISVGVGVGGGMPFGAYAQASHTWITPPTG